MGAQGTQTDGIGLEPLAPDADQQRRFGPIVEFCRLKGYGFPRWGAPNRAAPGRFFKVHPSGNVWCVMQGRSPTLLADILQELDPPGFPYAFQTGYGSYLVDAQDGLVLCLLSPEQNAFFESDPKGFVSAETQVIQNTLAAAARPAKA